MNYPIVVPDAMITSKCTFKCKYCFHGQTRNSEMDMDKYTKLADDGVLNGIYPFGGEPMLRLDSLIKFKEHVESTYSLGSSRDRILEGVRYIITNGTQVPDRILDLKKHSMRVQVSLDGPRDIQESERVANGSKSSFDIAMAAVQACHEHSVEWAIHGVGTKKHLDRFAEIVEFFVKTWFDHGHKDDIPEYLGNNFYMLMFEDDYTLEDARVFCEQLEKAYNWIKSTEYISEDRREEAAKSFLMRSGGVCGGGTILMGLTSDFQVSACHRSCLSGSFPSLGDVQDAENFKNKKYYNSLHRLKFRHKKMYSTETSLLDGHMGRKPCWFYWCPVTNYETSGSIYYQSPKFNMLVTILHERIGELLGEEAPDGSTRD